MKIEPIQGHSAPERVVKQILNNLETGEMKPGNRLPTQEKLSEMFGVGRSSIREATNALAIMGVLEIIQGKGTFIKKNAVKKLQPANIFEDFVESSDLFNLMEIRELLECYTAKKAAEVASEEQFSRLEKAVERLEKCEDDARGFMTEDLKFHIELANSANLPEVAEIIKVIHPVINRKLPVIIDAQRGKYLKNSIESARNIYKYALRGEGRLAMRCMRNHLGSAMDALQKEFNKKIKGL